MGLNFYVYKGVQEMGVGGWPQALKLEQPCPIAFDEWILQSIKYIFL